MINQTLVVVRTFVARRKNRLFPKRIYILKLFCNNMNSKEISVISELMKKKDKPNTIMSRGFFFNSYDLHIRMINCKRHGRMQ